MKDFQISIITIPIIVINYITVQRMELSAISFYDLLFSCAIVHRFLGL